MLHSLTSVPTLGSSKEEDDKLKDSLLSDKASFFSVFGANSIMTFSRKHRNNICSSRLNSSITAKKFLITWRFDFHRKNSSEEWKHQNTTPCSRRKTCDKLGWRIGDRQGTRETHQMDQGGNPEPHGRTTSHEPWRRQLPTKSCIYDCFLGTSTTYCAKNWTKKWCFHSAAKDFRWKSKC